MDAILLETFLWNTLWSRKIDLWPIFFFCLRLSYQFVCVLYTLRAAIHCCTCQGHRLCCPHIVTLSNGPAHRELIIRTGTVRLQEERRLMSIIANSEAVEPKSGWHEPLDDRESGHRATEVRLPSGAGPESGRPLNRCPVPPPCSRAPCAGPGPADGLLRNKHPERRHPVYFSVRVTRGCVNTYCTSTPGPFPWKILKYLRRFF